MKKIGISSLLVVLLAAVFVGPAYAATFDVDTTTDDPALQACTAAPNDCSLRGAIIAANANGVPDTINLDPALGTYALTIFGTDDDANAGDLDILEDLTINGNGAVVDGSGAVDRVFHILAPFGANPPTVEVFDLSVGGGVAPTSGGGFYLQSGSLRLTGSRVGLNQAPSVGGSGAGIYTQAGTTLVLNDTLVAQNTSLSHGAGIFSGGMTTINDSTIRNNTADGAGGGIYNFIGTMTINNSTITSNHANGTFIGAGGGGLFNYEATATLDNSVVNRNDAPSGNGGGLKGSGGMLILQNQTRVSGNTAVIGGGVELNSGATGDFSACAILNNTATDFGGGIASIGDLLTVSNCAVSFNTALSGGGLAHTHGEANVSGTTIRGNTATDNGGGVYVITADDSAQKLTLQDTTVRNNQANGAFGRGGGIYLYAASPHVNPTLLVRKSIIRDNVAQENGGGIYNTRHVVQILTTIITRNQATGNGTSDGGGIFNHGGTVVMGRTAIAKNMADDKGGAIVNRDADGATAIVSVNNSTLSENSAGTDGGAVYNEVLIGGSTVEVFFLSATIAANDTPAGTDGVVADGGTVTFLNTLNGPQLTIGSDCGTLAGGAIVSAGFNHETLASCGFALNGNPMIGPLALNGGGTYTHALLAGSPLINAGNPAGCDADSDGDGVPDTALTFDQRGPGFPRIVGVACDIGAYEFP